MHIEKGAVAGGNSDMNYYNLSLAILAIACLRLLDDESADSMDFTN